MSSPKAKAASAPETETADSAAMTSPAVLPAMEQRANLLLRVAIFVYAVGITAALFTRAGSALGDVALMEWGWKHADIFLGERIAASVILLAAMTVLVYPTAIALLVIAALIFAEACAGHSFGGNPYAEYTPLAHALRYLTPVALVPLILTDRLLPAGPWRRQAAAWILRIAIAAVFIMHGLEALWLHPGFIDLIIGTFRNIFGVAVTESAASAMLRVIGVADIAIALALLYRPWRPLLAWMCFWALVTALARPLSLGWGSYPEVLVRASHIIAPIAVWYLVHADGLVKQAPRVRHLVSGLSRWLPGPKRAAAPN